MTRIANPISSNQKYGILRQDPGPVHSGSVHHPRGRTASCGLHSLARQLGRIILHGIISAIALIGGQDGDRPRTVPALGIPSSLVSAESQPLPLQVCEGAKRGHDLGGRKQPRALLGLLWLHHVVHRGGRCVSRTGVVLRVQNVFNLTVDVIE